MVCVGKEPWTDYCLEPPCGQMNVANEELYPVLKVIFVTIIVSLEFQFGIFTRNFEATEFSFS